MEVKEWSVTGSVGARCWYTLVVPPLCHHEVFAVALFHATHVLLYDDRVTLRARRASFFGTCRLLWVLRSGGTRIVITLVGREPELG